MNKYSHSHLLRSYTLIQEWQICDTHVVIPFSWASVNISNQFEQKILLTSTLTSEFFSVIEISVQDEFAIDDPHGEME